MLLEGLRIDNKVINIRLCEVSYVIEYVITNTLYVGDRIAETYCAHVKYFSTIVCVYSKLITILFANLKLVEIAKAIYYSNILSAVNLA